MSPAAAIVDLPAVQAACRPIGEWWREYLWSGIADQVGLDRALAGARDLPGLGGSLGAALAYVLAGCPGGSLGEAGDAFTIIAAVGRKSPLKNVPAAAALRSAWPRATRTG